MFLNYCTKRNFSTKQYKIHKKNPKQPPKQNNSFQTKKPRTISKNCSRQTFASIDPTKTKQIKILELMPKRQIAQPFSYIDIIQQ